MILVEQAAHLVPEVNSVPWTTNPVDICSEPRHICLQPEDPCNKLFDGLHEGRWSLSCLMTSVKLQYCSSL